MKTIHHLLPIAIIAPLISVSVAAANLAGNLPDFRELARDNSPAVVNISTTTKTASVSSRMPRGFSNPEIPEDSPLSEFFQRFFGEEGPAESEPRSSLGSGFIISKDGYVITNYHVIREADEVIVRLSDRSEYTASVIGSDASSDIAVLKVEPDNELPSVTLANGSELEVGEWVLAIGSPFGFDYSVTAGIVSAKGRSLPNDNYVPFIQTDVAINPGNSGGPLFNLDGEVVGVNSQIYSRTGGFMGVSFAIPIGVVMNVYEQIRDKGSVTRGWLGVLIQDVTAELAESFKMRRPHGALVSKVLEGSPAEKAGIQTGDIIVAFAESDIERSSNLPPIVGTTNVGDKIKVNIVRGGERRNLTVEIGALPQQKTLAETATAGSKKSSQLDEKLKISVVDLDAEARTALKVDEGGVLVEEIDSGPAFDAGLRVGDVILQVNNEKVADREKFLKIAATLQSGKTVPVLIQRHGGPLFLAMKVPIATG